MLLLLSSCETCTHGFVTELVPGIADDVSTLRCLTATLPRLFGQLTIAHPIVIIDPTSSDTVT